MTESTGFLVAMNNFACIMLFEFAFLAIHLIQDKLNVPLREQVGVVLVDIAGSIIFGIIGGLVISYGCGRLRITKGIDQSADFEAVIAFIE